MPALQSKDAQLFVYLAWETDDEQLEVPGDDYDQFQQAICTAVRVRLRSLCCHLRAIEILPGKAHLVVRFTASLPISAIARAAHEAAIEAILHLHERNFGKQLNPNGLWSWAYTARTLTPMDAAQAKAYLRQQSA